MLFFVVYICFQALKHEAVAQALAIVDIKKAELEGATKHLREVEETATLNALAAAHAKIESIEQDLFAERLALKDCIKERDDFKSQFKC